MVDRTPEVRGFVGYVAGNTLALLVGLLSAYFALILSHTVSADVINIKTVDAMTYYSEARLILAGHAGLMYNWSALAHVESSVAGAAPATFGVLINPYPPFFVTAFLPLALLPYGAAFIGWLAINCALLMSALYMLERYAGLERKKALAFRWLALTCLPVFMALGDGQSSAYLLVLLTGCLLALRSQRLVLAGMALAAASIKPGYILPILLVFVIQQRWRVLASYAVSGAVLLVAPLPIFGLSIYRSFLQLLIQISGWQGRSFHHPLWYHHVPVAPGIYAAQWNHSLAGFAELLLAGRMSTIVYGAASLGVLLLLAMCTVRATNPDIPFGIAVVAGVLVSPHTLAYDLTLLLIPVAMALRYRSAARVALRIALPVVLVFGYLAITVGYRLAFLFPLQVSVFGSAALLLWMSVLAVRVRVSAPGTADAVTATEGVLAG